MLDRLLDDILYLILGHLTIPRYGLLVANYSWASKSSIRFRLLNDDASFTSSTGNLASLCLVCHRLNSFVQPMLYNTFALGPGQAQSQKSTYDFKGRLSSFVLTLSRRKDLAALVKTAYISKALLHGVNYDEKAYHALTEGAASLGIDLESAWRRRFEDPENCEKSVYKRAQYAFIQSSGSPPSRSGRDDYERFHRRWLAQEVVAVLIAMLPNLEQLIVPHPFLGPGDLVPYFAFHAIRDPDEPLPLKTIHTGSTVFGILPILEQAPGLTSLNLHWMVPSDNFTRFKTKQWQADFRAGDYLPDLPRLKTLRIVQSRVDEAWLGKFLSHCTGGLETFFYETRFPHSIRVLAGRDACRPTKLVEYLLAAGHDRSLRSLYLDFRIPGWAREAHVPSLESFTLLKDLSISTVSWYPQYITATNALSQLNDTATLFPQCIMTAEFPSELSESASWSPSATKIMTTSKLSDLLPPNIQKLSLLGGQEVDIAALETQLLQLGSLQKHGQFPEIRHIVCDSETQETLDTLQPVLSMAGIGLSFQTLTPTFDMAYGAMRGDEDHHFQLPDESSEDDLY